MNQSYLRLFAEQRAQEEIHLSNLKNRLGNKKIRLLYTNMCLVAGGLEKTIWLLGQKLDRSIFEPELHTAYGGKWEEVMSKVMPVHKAEDIEQLVRDEGFKLVHIFNVSDLYRLWEKVALVETVEGYGTVFLSNAEKQGLDRLIFCSENIKNTLLPLVNISRERIKIMPNSIDLDKHITAGKLRRRIGIGNRKLIGWVGRLSPEKNLDLFLEVADVLYKEYSFVIIGEAWNATINIEYLEKMKENKADIHWIRDVDPDEIMDYIADLDLLCNTSYTEGHPFTILEAMAVRVPVVSMCVGSVPDIIDEETGFLVFREKDYVSTVRRAMREWKKVIQPAYAKVLMNHNLKDYVRQQEIVYLEEFFNFNSRRPNAGNIACP